MEKSAYKRVQPMLSMKMNNGRRISKPRTLQEIQKDSEKLLSSFDKSYKRQINPHLYKVSLSEDLMRLKTKLIRDAKVQQEIKK